VNHFFMQHNRFKSNKGGVYVRKVQTPVGEKARP